MSTNTFRAAYWIAADSQADVLLTSEEQKHLPDELLMAVAQSTAIDIGLEVGEGRIVIGEYTV